MNIRIIILASLFLNVPFSALAETDMQSTASKLVAETPLKTNSILERTKKTSSIPGKETLSNVLESVIFAYAASGGIAKSSKLGGYTNMGINTLVVSLGTLTSKILKNDTKNIDMDLASIILKVIISGGGLTALLIKYGPIEKSDSNIIPVLINSGILGIANYLLQELKVYKKNKIKKEIKPKSLK